MADDLPEVKQDPPITEVVKHRVADKLTSGEKETFEAKIKELEKRIEELLAEILELKKVPAAKKSGWTLID